MQNETTRAGTEGLALNALAVLCGQREVVEYD